MLRVNELWLMTSLEGWLVKVGLDIGEVKIGEGGLCDLAVGGRGGS
jgi:hypothetical protein